MFWFIKERLICESLAWPRLAGLAITHVILMTISPADSATMAPRDTGCHLITGPG